MALQIDQKFIPGKAYVMIADPFTPAPDYKTLVPHTVTGGFENIGDISAENVFSLAREGGEKTVKRTHANSSARVITSPTTWTLNVNALQLNTTVFNLAFNGVNDPSKDSYKIKSGAQLVNKAVFILLVDGDNRAGMYFSNTSIGLGDVPSFGLEDFIEIPIACSILEDELTGDVFEFFHPGFGSGVALVDAEAMTEVEADGTISEVAITKAGTGYTAGSTVAFVGGGATEAATGTVQVANGRVIAVTITDPGAGYTSDPEVVFTRAA